jgi:hypothetical protein
MTAAFGTRPKQRLNRVMDALNFEYPDYERLDRGAEDSCFEEKERCGFEAKKSC